MRVQRVALIEATRQRPADVDNVGARRESHRPCPSVATAVQPLICADICRVVGLDVVARDCGQRLGVVIARPLRDEDNWSIEWTGCDL